MDHIALFFAYMDTLNTMIRNYNSKKNVNIFLEELTQIIERVQTVLPKIYKDTGKENRKRCQGVLTIENTNDNKSCLLSIFIQHVYEQINNDQGILDNEKFIEKFYNFLWLFWQQFGFYSLNIADFIHDFVNHVNSITRLDYMIIRCPQKSNIPHSGVNETNYICGRAMLYNVEPNKNTRLIVFNTIASNNMNMDTDYYFDEIYPNLQ